MYASMGTLCNFGPNEFVAIGQALSALPNQVIWKLAPGDLPGNATVDSLNLASNIKVSTSTMLQTAAMRDCSRNLEVHLRLRCSLYSSRFYAFPHHCC